MVPARMVSLKTLRALMDILLEDVSRTWPPASGHLPARRQPALLAGPWSELADEEAPVELEALGDLDSPRVDLPTPSWTAVLRVGLWSRRGGVGPVTVISTSWVRLMALQGLGWLTT